MALWCALAGVVVGVVAIVARRDPGRSPVEELGRVQRFVASAGTGRFEGNSRSESGRGTDQAGSTSIDVTRVEGSFQLPDRMRFVEDGGDYVSEGVVVGRASYVREADSRAELQSEPWEYEELPERGTGQSPSTEAESPDEAAAAALSSAAGFFGAAGAPFDLSALLGRLNPVQRVSAGVLEAHLTVRDFMPPDMLAEMEQADAGEPGDQEDEAEWQATMNFLDDPVVIRLTHHDDGRLDEMVITMQSTDEDDEKTVDRTSLRFSGWGEPVQIAAPPRDQVDLTPEIDEEGLSAFGAFRVLAPRSVPAGLVLESGHANEGDAEDEMCASVDLDYGPPSRRLTPDAVAAPSLHLRLLDASCPWVRSEAMWDSDGSAETARVGAYQAQIRRSPRAASRAGAPTVHVRFTVGDVVVEAFSNLAESETVAALASIGPLDLASHPVAREEPPPGS